MELTGYHRADVEIHEWDPATRDVFEFVRDQIAQVLPGVAVEHIGSSAVPGMPGKNYVDVMVLPNDSAAIEATAATIDGLGLEHARGYRPKRPFFVGAVRHDEMDTNVHLYVIPAGADEAITQHGLAEALRAGPSGSPNRGSAGGTASLGLDAVSRWTEPRWVVGFEVTLVAYRSRFSMATVSVSLVL